MSPNSSRGEREGKFSAEIPYAPEQGIFSCMQGIISAFSTGAGKSANYHRLYQQYQARPTLKDALSALRRYSRGAVQMFAGSPGGCDAMPSR
ncbi:MAG: hypothetical protein WAV18_14415, partial [Roseiarcus sp.]